MSDLVKNIFRLVIFTLIQVYVLDKLRLHRFVIPSIYYLFVLWLPFSLPRLGLLLAAFFAGLVLDYFTLTPGLHAAACVMIAYVRPYIISVLTPNDTTEFNYREPSARAMGWAPYMVYVTVLTLVHHIWLTFLEWLQVGNILEFLIKVGATTGISLVLIMITELLFPRKVRYRTNSGD